MGKNKKTERMLVVFHLLTCGEEISFKVVTDIVPVSKKPYIGTSAC